MANRKAKSKLQLDGGLNLPQETAERVLVLDANGDAKSSSVSTTTLSYLDATSSIQGQLDNKLEASDLQEIEEDINSLESDVADLQALTGVPAESTDLGTFNEDIIPDGSTIKEAIQALETELAILPEPLFYAGTYDPVTNTPDLDLEDNRVSGAVHYVTADGTHDFDTHGGVIEMNQGDKLVYNGITWDKWDHTDQVASVFGRTGAITAQAGDYAAEQVSFAADQSELESTDVRSAIEEVDAKVTLSDEAIQDHIESTEAHAAEHITLSSAKLSSTDVKAALEELSDEKFDSADFTTEFASELATKTTDDLAEGATNLYHTDARAVAAVAATLIDSNSIELSYDPQDNEIRSDLRVQQSITVDANGVKLVGDVEAPGEVKYYGTDSDGVKGFHSIPVQGSPGDIQETTFVGSNDQSTFANVTGFAFNNAVVRSFTAHVSVVIDATEQLFESFDLHGIQKASGWDMSVMATGDDSGVNFDITPTGQIQYTSEDYNGFESLEIRFRAVTTSI